MTTPVPPAPSAGQPPLPPAKKSNLLLWIIGGVVVIMIGFTAMCGLGGYLLMRTAKKSGFDANLITNNPGYAAAKMAVILNPELETISSDDGSGTITVREKKTGKVMTFKFDADKKTMVMTGEDGKEVTISANGDGDNGTVRVQSSEGTATFGAGAGNSMPAWVPAYPGSTPQGTFSSQTPDGSQNSYSFKTKDAASKVLEYYQNALKSAGFAINMMSSGGQGGMVMAEDGSKKRSVTVTVGTSSDGTDAAVIVVEKK